MASDYERAILNHYNLSSPFPEAWPEDKDRNGDSDDDQTNKATSKLARSSKSRYSALGRGANDRRSLVPGLQRSRDGVENLVQKDEPDPLGTTESVVRTLRQQGLPVDDDVRLRMFICRIN